MQGISFQPEQASSIARSVDHLYFFITAVTLFFTIVIFSIIFYFGSSLYFQNSEPPPGAMEIFVTGKQFMWKAEHPEGQREINELHVPLGRPVKLTMTSEDVIHDFFVPAFRVKKDVLPGRYTSMWFEPTKLGTACRANRWRRPEKDCFAKTAASRVISPTAPDRRRPFSAYTGIRSISPMVKHSWRTTPTFASRS